MSMTERPFLTECVQGLEPEPTRWFCLFGRRGFCLVLFVFYCIYGCGLTPLALELGRVHTGPFSCTLFPVQRSL